MGISRLKTVCCVREYLISLREINLFRSIFQTILSGAKLLVIAGMHFLIFSSKGNSDSLCLE